MKHGWAVESGFRRSNRIVGFRKDRAAASDETHVLRRYGAEEGFQSIGILAPLAGYLPIALA
jgi:hypothetical protein